MNTYTCPEYLCEVSVEIALYFELHEKTNLWLLIGFDICQNLVFFV